MGNPPVGFGPASGELAVLLRIRADIAGRTIVVSLSYPFSFAGWHLGNLLNLKFRSGKGLARL